MIAGRIARSGGGLGRDDAGVAAVEFAILLPLLILLFFGGITIVNVINVSRKVTITTRALADLTSQYTTMAQSDMNTIMGASAQILAPYGTAPLGMRISEFSVTIAKAALVTVTTCTVIWSSAQGTGMSAYKAGLGSTCTVPAGLIPTPSGIGGVTSVFLIYAETSYAYTAPVNIGPINAFGVQWIPSGFGTFNLGDRIFMLPRVSSSIAYSGS